MLKKIIFVFPVLMGFVTCFGFVAYASSFDLPSIPDDPYFHWVVTLNSSGVYYLRFSEVAITYRSEPDERLYFRRERRYELKNNVWEFKGQSPHPASLESMLGNIVYSNHDIYYYQDNSGTVFFYHHPVRYIRLTPQQMMKAVPLMVIQIILGILILSIAFWKAWQLLLRLLRMA